MQRLANARELLDGPLDDRAALAGNLRDLRRINRLFGGVRLSRGALEDLSGTAARPGTDTGASAAIDRRMRLLDVGTGAADIPLALVERGRHTERPIRVVAIDARPEVLEAAIALEPRLVTDADIELHVADGLRLPFPDAAFDVAHASLVLHHLEPPDAIHLLAEMRRVARLGVVVNDLARSVAGVAGAWLLTHSLARNRFTRNDAPLSVRRSYGPAEMHQLLAAAGLRPVSHRSALFGLRYAIAAVAAVATVAS